MHTLTQTIRYTIIHGGRRTNSRLVNISQMIDIGFNIIEFFGDCLIGLLMGGVAGWISGWCIGHIYSELYTPIHFISFEVVNKWYFLPYEYAVYGMVRGSILGASIVLLMLVIRSIKQRQKEITESVKS